MPLLRYRSPRSVLAALALGVATIASAVTFATPAQATLSGTGWTAAQLPPGFVVADGSNGPAISPVSCVAGSRHCVAITADQAVTTFGFLIGQGVLVTDDGGKTWTGYATFPVSTVYATSLSCPSVSDCWASGFGAAGSPAVAHSTDGGRTWTDVTPPQWTASQTAGAIDCVTARVCWVVGSTWDPASVPPQTPWAASTTNGGVTWTISTNLPAIAVYDPNGSYQLNGISCVSPRSCVAVGGLNFADGRAQVISTRDGGATWSLPADPALSGLQQLFSVSCLPADGGLPVCHAAAGAFGAAGPVALGSADGGATWTGLTTLDTTGWLNSISCANARHCWAAGAGTTVGLAGTANGGGTWSVVTSDTSNEQGMVSCASVRFCVAATDNALWVTTTGGGLAAGG